MQKKALEVAALVTKGSELLKDLERHGPSFISRPVIADILALLTNADDPQGNMTKPKTKPKVWIASLSLDQFKRPLAAML